MLIDRRTVGGKDIICTGCGELTEVAIQWSALVYLRKNKRAKGELFLCRECAQHLMRILLEDIISYDNGVHVSLLNVMYHGQKEQYDLFKKENLKFGRYKPRGALL